MTNPAGLYLPCLHSLSGNFGVAVGTITGGAAPSSSIFPAINDAVLVPFETTQTHLIKRLFVINGATASGNIDVGIYSDSGARIVSSGSTVQAGTNAPQFFDNTDFLLAPGRYYWAVAMDTIGGTVFRISATAARLQALGMARMGTAFSLPATVTFSAATALFLPCVGAEVVRVL